MNVRPLTSLALEWRDDAALLRRRGAPRQADALESAAEDLEERLRAWELEALTLDEAAAESGYSYSTLQHRVASGDLPNAGESGSPRIRRCDLPSKGGSAGPTAEPDLAEEMTLRRMG